MEDLRHEVAILEAEILLRELTEDGGGDMIEPEDRDSKDTMETQPPGPAAGDDFDPFEWYAYLGRDPYGNSTLYESIEEQRKITDWADHHLLDHRWADPLNEIARRFYKAWQDEPPDHRTGLTDGSRRRPMAACWPDVVLRAVLRERKHDLRVYDEQPDEDDPWDLRADLVIGIEILERELELRESGVLDLLNYLRDSGYEVKLVPGQPRTMPPPGPTLGTLYASVEPDDKLTGELRKKVDKHRALLVRALVREVEVERSPFSAELTEPATN